MALQPPPQIAAALNMICRWPVCDEDLGDESGRKWAAFGMTQLDASSIADAHVARTTSRNEGDDVRSLERDAREISDQAGDAALAAVYIGSGLQISAMIVLTTKVTLIVVAVRFAMRQYQLAMAAGPTGGFSLASVPLLVEHNRLAVREVVRKMVDLLERSALRLFKKASELLGKSPTRQAGMPMPPHRPPPVLRGPDNYLEAAAVKDVDVKSIKPYPIWTRERVPLYRADNRHPDVVFEHGFHPQDTSMTSLDDYVNKGTPSAFVGTSRRQDIDNVFPRQYVYEVDAPGGIDVQATLPVKSAQLSHEQEIAFPGGVHRRYISGAWPAGVPRTPENFIRNPHHDPFPGYSQT